MIRFFDEALLAPMSFSLACLATAVYFEARGEPVVGQVAVAQVVMNRVASRRYPDDVCAVVKQGSLSARLRGCQFEFYCDGRPERIRDEDAYHLAFVVAEAVVAGVEPDRTGGGADHFHSGPNPYWAKRLQRTNAIGGHVFYASQ